MVIGASGITLDLAGHTIDGTGPGAGGHGVRNAGADNVTVTNGRIQQFQFGVSILSADENLLTGLTLTDSGSGVYLERGLADPDTGQRHALLGHRGHAVPRKVTST